MGMIKYDKKDISFIQHKIRRVKEMTNVTNLTTDITEVEHITDPALRQEVEDGTITLEEARERIAFRRASESFL